MPTSRMMGAPASGHSLRLMIVLTGALVAARGVTSGLVPLVPQEAYYWMYAQHLQLSYFDHPPMIAWLIRLGTIALGNSEVGVRVMGQILMLAASASLYGWSRLWYNRRISLMAALMLQIAPIFFTLGFIATMDAGLIFFWITAMLGFGLAVRRGRKAGWYLAGAAVGAAMLTKYTAVFLPVGFLLCLTCLRPWRRHLRTIHPWLALMLAGLMFCPVIAWNLRHHWASFRYQCFGRFDADKNPHPGLHYFLGEQFLVLTPFVFVVLPILLRQAWHRGSGRRSPRQVVALAFFIPMFAVMAASAIRHDVHINWTAPLYLSLIPFVVHALSVRARRAAGAGIWKRGPMATVALSGAVNLGGLSILLCLPLWSAHISSPFGPWQPLATQVEQLEDQLKLETGVEPLVIAEGKFELASELAFYRGTADGDRPSYSTTSQWIIDGHDGIGFPYWMKRNDWIGRDCIVVGPDKHFRQETEPWFASVEIRELPAIHLGHPLAIAVCRGLRRERNSVVAVSPVVHVDAD